jgi:hypothetical protein
MGRDFTLEGGRRAVDFLLEEHVTSLTENGRVVLTFPREVEIHPNMFLKTMLEAGVPLGYGFSVKGHRHTLADLVEGARLQLRPAALAGRTAEAAYNRSELAWTIIALTRTTSPVKPRWTNAWGEVVDLHAVVASALDTLEEASAPLSEAMKAGRPLTAKAPVHKFACGGTHLIYSIIAAAHAGYVADGRAQRVGQQIDLLQWRVGADVELIDRFYAQRRALPMAEWFHLSSRLKMLGHAEECLALARRRRVVARSATQEGQHRAGVAQLRRVLSDLEARDMTVLRTAKPELYREIVGDVCHAEHGLTLS